MKRYWDELRPLEKRLVVGVGAVVFIILNLWFVVPHFSDWGQVHRKMDNALVKLQQYNQELSHTNALERELRQIEDQEGTSVPPEDQATHFATTISSQLIQVGLVPRSTGPIRSFTNQNFIEMSQMINLEAKEQPLVDFLYKLGEGASLIRVRDLRLNPDPSHQLLAATITLVGSYQAKTPARGATAPARTAPARTTPPVMPRPSPTTTSTKAATPPGKSGPPTTTKVSAPPGRVPTNFMKQINPMSRPGMTNKPANTKKS